jgi:hypothetical protein
VCGGKRLPLQLWHRRHSLNCWQLKSKEARNHIAGRLIITLVNPVDLAS